MKRFFNDGMTVLFQGDSVTDCGRDRSIASGMECMGDGYPKVFAQIYIMCFDKLQFVVYCIFEVKKCLYMTAIENDCANDF